MGASREEVLRILHPRTDEISPGNSRADPAGIHAERADPAAAASAPLRFFRNPGIVAMGIVARGVLKVDL
jgi:hypothetical protein